MLRKSRSHLLNLTTQGVILLIVMIILTSIAIGIPAIWLIRQQLDRQAWELVRQGSRTTEVLLDSRYQELTNLAILAAQRPTLAELLALGDQERLTSYLETLRSGAGLDLVMVCSHQKVPVVQVGIPIFEQACESILSDRVYQSTAGAALSGGLLAFQPILANPDQLVVVGRAFDHDFSEQLSEQIGLEHLLLLNGELIEGSLPDDRYAWETISRQQTVSEIVTLDGTRYFAIRSQYGATDLETIVLLPGTAIAETQQQLTQTLTGGILLVTLICSIMAILLTKRVSLPLERLRDSAIALRKGDLTSPVPTHTKIKEIAEVAYALEDDSIALRHTLEELQKEKAWGDYLLESVVEGIVTLDRLGRITFFSQGAERITGWKQEQVLGKAIDEVFRLAERETLFSQRIPSPGARQEIVTILVNGRPLILAINGAKLAPPEAGKASWAVSIRDISNEEAMRGLLGDFLSNITHEFRTPLTALAVSIELLLDQLPDLNQDELRELLVSNHLGVLSLQNLIDNLLEGASIETGRFQVFPRPMDLTELIQEVVRVMQPLMDKNRHQLQMDLPADLPLVQADHRRTSQVLVNLLSNAIKWGPQGSLLFLSALVSEGAAKVSVADQGPGILPEHKQDLFVRFGHIHSDNGRAEYGAGLGLSVVKAIVESQNGQVGVEDRTGGGAVFWFTIPLAAVDAPGEEDK